MPLHEWKETFEFNYSTGLYDLGTEHSPTTWIFEASSFVPCGKITNGKHYSIITDHLGTPIEAYNQEGELIWERELDLYGNSHQGFAKENFRCPFKYQGQYYDSEVELCYNRFRYYHPETGRYISEDPIKLLGGFNVFAYVSDSSAWVDIWGLLVGDILTEGLVYRAGGNTLNNYTPSLPKDLNGLSMFSDTDTLKQRLPKADKAQVIDLSKLGDKLVAIDDGNGHISIKPANDINGIEMKKWGDLKGSDELPNPLAEQIKKSRVDTVKLYKK